MTVTTVVVGIAGSGKTQIAMDLMEQRLRNGLKWYEIGFASFSRAACYEAAERAARITGVSQERLQKEGFFRTIHSSALRCLGVDPKVILDPESASGKKWFEETFGVQRGGEAGTLASEVASILDKWDVLRSSLGQLSHPSAYDTPDKWHDTPDNVVSCKSPMFSGSIDTHDTPEKVVTAPVSQHKTLGKSEVFSPNTIMSVKKKDHIDQYGVGCKNFCAESSIKQFLSSQTPIGVGLASVVTTFSGVSMVTEPTGRKTTTSENPVFFEVIDKYEAQKKVTGKLDFTDLLLRFAGFSAVASPLSGVSCIKVDSAYAEGTPPSEIKLWMFDEYQDCSVLLDAAAARLSEAAEEVFMLGDTYQSVYGFSGSDWRVMRSREMVAKQAGRRVLLNRSWRNTKTTLDWGERVLREDRQYEERKPWTGKGDGTVGMMENRVFLEEIEKIANMDTLVIGRTWFSLDRVKSSLDQRGIPWRSCQEKQKSRWEAPVKIAFVLTMRALVAGEKISEQDWRRVTEELPQKWEGMELFRRGEKAKWKKFECSGEPKMGLDRIEEWGATGNFRVFLSEEMWRRDAYLLIDTAIEKYGVDLVRDPKIRIGSVHSVKGMQARNVFCMATSSEKAAGGDFYEELFLKYVAITRSSLNYRVVVDLVEHARGKPLFLACPKGYWQFDNVMPEDNGDTGTQDSGGDRGVDPETARLLGLQVSGRPVLGDRDPGSAAVCAGEIRGSGGEAEVRPSDASPAGSDEDYDLSWCDL
jgi:superfamily I DNA/RNA helicase